MTMTMTRAGHYTVTDGGVLVGRITGDFVIGFRAELPDGTFLLDVYDEPSTAAEALAAEQFRAGDEQAGAVHQDV
ncbi:MAG TPA: hypothetical protein VFL99_10130 [Segeticoccus sp.]|uniref:hypothetical protein n=1 Tax=Segeticoccus sp. TaxID=2706531 RepID=UPI002D7E6B8B|nr:hypothetical protein [Segeticoccus sp.]HET8600672.1 hypothetical protein [Segeticoccus sp.]